MMGSYAGQLDPKQRWQVIAYIKSVQAEKSGVAFDMISEEPKFVEHSEDEHGESMEEAEAHTEDGDAHDHKDGEEHEHEGEEEHGHDHEDGHDHAGGEEHGAH